jgi:hypothetical protein
MKQNKAKQNETKENVLRFPWIGQTKQSLTKKNNATHTGSKAKQSKTNRFAIPIDWRTPLVIIDSRKVRDNLKIL